jgi:acyl-CoA thioesterase-1
MQFLGSISGGPRGRAFAIASLARGSALASAACLVVSMAWLAGIARAEAEAPAIKILAFGDSLVHGYGLTAAETFPVQLEAALRRLGQPVRVINAGNSGDTTAAGLARLDWALQDAPDAVIVELGANDGLRGIDPVETYANLDRILGRLNVAGVAVLLTGMLAPRNLGADYAGEFDAVYPRLAEQHGVALYPFFLDGVAADPALNQDDGMHPNGAGVAVIVERITPAVVRLLETLDGAQPRRAEQNGG